MQDPCFNELIVIETSCPKNGMSWAAFPRDCGKGAKAKSHLQPPVTAQLQVFSVSCTSARKKLVLVQPKSVVNAQTWPHAELISHITIREWTATQFWGAAAAMLSVRSSLRLCVIVLVCVLTLFSLSLVGVLPVLQVSVFGSSHPSLPVPLLAHS